jgi:hypothetical protein
VDATTATALTGIAGVTGTVASGWLAYRSAKESADEESRRLRAQHAEQERLERKKAYADALAIASSLMWIDLSQDSERFEELQERWYYTMSQITLMASAEVREHMIGLTQILSAGEGDHWRQQIRDAARPLTDAMRRDVALAADASR